LVAVKNKFEKIKKTAFTSPTFFQFKIRIALGVMCCENFRRFHQRKFKKITNKAIKRAKNTFIWAFII